MIDFHYELDFELKDIIKYSDWITRIIKEEGYTLAQLDYIFCDDSYLLEMNQQYLQHDTFTDIITFDYTEETRVAGDVFISVDRVRENAAEYKVTFPEELRRVMAHGVLHLLGYKDKSVEEQSSMRKKENESLSLFHVEQ